jgi:hypothetical protein
MENVDNERDTFPNMPTFCALRSGKAFVINTAEENVAGHKMMGLGRETFGCRSSFLEKP